MVRIRLDLGAEEYRALVRLSELELRSIGEQARHVVREELRRRGLLPTPEEVAANA